MADEKRSWWRAALEVSSIVGSILLALFVDASWASHLERAEEQEILRSLGADFEENLTVLRRARESHEGIRSRGAGLLDSIALFGRTGRVPDVAELVLRQTDWETYDPVEGTLESLIGSGKLDLLQSDSLRAALAAWPDQVADLNEDEELLRSAARERILPIVFLHVSMAELQTRVQDQETGTESPAGASTPAGLPSLLSSIEFANWVRDQVEWRAYLLRPDGEIGRLETVLERTIRLITSEQDR